MFSKLDDYLMLTMNDFSKKKKKKMQENLITEKLDKTILQPGMVFAVDGSVTVPGKFRAQVGDSFIVTDTGYEQITTHPNTLAEVTI